MVDGGRLAALSARLAGGETLPGADLLALGRDPFGHDLVGLVLDHVSLERVVGHLDVDERHHQPFGLVHGGVWCTVVESVASFAGSLRVAADGRAAVGLSNTTDFLRVHRAGRVDAVAEPLHVGRTQHLWQVVIARGDDGKPLARGQVRLQIVDRARFGARQDGA